MSVSVLRRKIHPLFKTSMDQMIRASIHGNGFSELCAILSRVVTKNIPTTDDGQISKDTRVTRSSQAMIPDPKTDKRRHQRRDQSQRLKNNRYIMFNDWEWIWKYHDWTTLAGIYNYSMPKLMSIVTLFDQHVSSESHLQCPAMNQTRSLFQSRVFDRHIWWKWMWHVGYIRHGINWGKLEQPTRFIDVYEVLEDCLVSHRLHSDIIAIITDYVVEEEDDAYQTSRLSSEQIRQAIWYCTLYTHVDFGRTVERAISLFSHRDYIDSRVIDSRNTALNVSHAPMDPISVTRVSWKIMVTNGETVCTFVPMSLPKCKMECIGAIIDSNHFADGERTWWLWSRDLLPYVAMTMTDKISTIPRFGQHATRGSRIPRIGQLATPVSALRHAFSQRKHAIGANVQVYQFDPIRPLVSMRHVLSMPVHELYDQSAGYIMHTNLGRIQRTNVCRLDRVQMWLVILQHMNSNDKTQYFNGRLEGHSGLAVKMIESNVNAYSKHGRKRSRKRAFHHSVRFVISCPEEHWQLRVSVYDESNDVSRLHCPVSLAYGCMHTRSCAHALNIGAYILQQVYSARFGTLLPDSNLSRRLNILAETSHLVQTWSSTIPYDDVCFDKLIYHASIDYCKTTVGFQPNSAHMTYQNTYPNGNIRLQLYTDKDGYHIVTTAEPAMFLSPTNELYVYKIVYEPETKMPCIARLMIEQGSFIAMRSHNKICTARVFVDRIDRLEPNFFELCCDCNIKVAVMTVVRHNHEKKSQNEFHTDATDFEIHRYTARDCPSREDIQLALITKKPREPSVYCFDCARSHRNEKLSLIDWLAPGKSTPVSRGVPPMFASAVIYRAQQWMPTIANFVAQHSNDCNTPGYYAMFTPESLLGYIRVNPIHTVEELIQFHRKQREREYVCASSLSHVLTLLLSHDIAPTVLDYMESTVKTPLRNQPVSNTQPTLPDSDTHLDRLLSSW
jgi:hypothetical protein